MQKKNIIRLGVIILNLIIMLNICACSKQDSNIPDPGTPEPEYHNGIFTGDFGTLIFTGNGTNVNVMLSQEVIDACGGFPSPSECQYSFLWHDSEKCRYDVATVFRLHNKSEEKTLDFNIICVADDSISLTLKSAKKDIGTLEFKKFQG